MKVALSIEVTDPQRAALTGTKRLATRDEVRNFLEGVINSLSNSEAPAEEPTLTLPPSVASPTSNAGASDPLARLLLTKNEKQTVVRLTKEGHPPSYILGWIKGGRMLKAK